ncbi:xanthine dehydrogenase YagR molybdenum-binding subunit [Amycolatopsis xylanica]|uniref:Xanthine dehydrogenase YagR molybdenum-binding subunit n=1 Tax=Amycolatopsis xylanica TaxID=589385 RepID=A0A1H3NNY9_9PSEU|nr:xanthine dehydrogenase family protein molybdopterin-binding subunit [Amycolatopsis xylanica]SDY90631.1 xanthine dehydrogenase YagR molybdenum-binding subunit [Amycolatopsis xylanica]
MSSPLGKEIDRFEARLKVTGRALYAADNNVTGLAYGYLVTSTIGLGTVTAMDTAAAAGSPGVLAVYTPFNPLKLFAYGGDQNDESTPPLQDTGVRYHGQVIGLVVAETFEQARDAAALVTVSYDAKPPAASFPAALPNATPIKNSPTAGVLAPGVTSIADAIAASPVTVTAMYTTAAQNHNPMEPHATVAVWTGDHLTLYTATQGTPLVVSRMSKTLGVDAAKIHVLNPFQGGAFGCKWGNWAHTPLTAAAARELGRPVKTVLTREQLFTVVGHRAFSSQIVTLGAAADGTLNAIKHDGVSSRSASANFQENAGNISLNTYASPNIEINRKTVTLDSPATTIMRAPSDATGSFALESALDELALKLGMDPLALRQKNNSTVAATSKKPFSGKHLDECYRIGAEAFGWSRRNPVPGSVVDGDWLVGMGMGTAFFSAGRGAASIKIRLRADGTAVVSGTGSDSGTGQATVYCIVGADSLGIPLKQVTADFGDSAAPVNANAGGSASTASNGTAVQVAADAVKAELLKVANEHPPFQGKNPVYERGFVKADGVSMSFGSLLTSLNMAEVEATATSPKNPDTVHQFMSFGAHFVEVRVHRRTREPRVSRVVSVMDAGRIVNAKAARNQIMGGVIMGIGAALLEDMRLEPTGRIANANLAGYLVPVNADIPELDVRFLGIPDPLISPLGARGIGELGIVGVTGAVANAVFNATGKRVRDLPITCERLQE